MYVYVVHYTQVSVTIAYTHAKKYLLASLGFLLLILFVPRFIRHSFFFFFFFCNGRVIHTRWLIVERFFFYFSASLWKTMIVDVV